MFLVEDGQDGRSISGALSRRDDSTVLVDHAALKRRFMCVGLPPNLFQIAKFYVAMASLAGFCLLCRLFPIDNVISTYIS